MQNSEERICQNCKQNFVIEPEDFDFYKKIDVPPPTFCPECRAVRRMSWRNERALYKRKCGFTDKEIISCFSPESGITIYDHDIWWSDKWDPLSYGMEYDFTKPFFAQLKKLLSRFPMPALFNNRCYTSEYLNHCGEEKNAYLIFASWGGENLSYSSKIMNSKDSIDSLASGYIELCYEIVNSTKLYRCAFVRDSENCSDSYFLYDCRGCTNCFGCVSLRNKSYYIFNKPYSREEYLEKIKAFDIGSFAGLKQIKQEFSKLGAGIPQRFANIFNAQNATGDNLSNVKRCFTCFDIADAQDSKYLVNGGIKLADSYDSYGVGVNSELLYEVVDVGVDGSRLLFDIFSWSDMNVRYSYACHGSQNLFGCIGINKKSYCILNKQYSKEEYEKLVPKIIEHMNDMPYVDSKGKIYKYGEFFPSEISPFAYNETIAQEYFPLAKEEALSRGYKWKEPEQRNYEVTIKPENLPDDIKDINESILKEIIGCQHWPANPPTGGGGCNEQCTQAFRIIPDELAFYKKMNLPLPRLCPNCRHYERLKQKNPMKLWHRKCQCAGVKSENEVYSNTIAHHHDTEHCPNEFETSYAPERQEIIYCEQCYNSEVV